MSDLESLTQLPDDFDGCVRLFPLPGVVTFPHVMQPLHIFEPRYCDMLRDALATNRLIAMTTLKEGWEQDYDGRPALEDFGVIGRIVSHTPTDDDRHNILLLGMQRVRILEEFQSAETYRSARVELLPDVYTSDSDAARLNLKRTVLTSFRQTLPESALAQDSFNELLDSQMPLGVVCDIIAYTADIPMSSKLGLLGETDVDRRAQILVEALKVMTGEASTNSNASTPLPMKFPPPFSVN